MTSRITIYDDDHRALRAARRILNRLREAGLDVDAHGESLALTLDGLDALDSRIMASEKDSFSRHADLLGILAAPSRRHLEPVA